MSAMVYVSLTGLELKRPWHVFRFYRHAVPSFMQARKATGNLSAGTRSIGGIHYTLTVWKSPADMRRFMVAGAHAKAMKAFGSFASGKTCGYITDAAPSWEMVPALLDEKGTSYG